jgi:hypothetical protein
MLHQDGNVRLKLRKQKPCYAPAPYKPGYLMKLGNLSLKEARALIDRHAGDRYAINADLLARRNRPQ